MNAALAIPAAFALPDHVADAPMVAANDAYGEISLGGIRTACLSRDGLARMMLSDCLEARRTNASPKLVFAVNGHAVALAGHDRNFRDLFAQADIVHADGQAAVFASRLLTTTPIPERSATTDFIHQD